MNALESIFLTSLIILFYSYLGYGIVLYIMVKIKSVFKGSANAEPTELPEITHVIAAFNEEDCIQEKIDNCLALDYPQDKVTTVIVADGSSDSTVDIIKANPHIKLYFSPERKGKLNAVDRVMKEVQTGITVFSDANSILTKNALTDLVSHFRNEKVGAVAGEKVVLNGEEEDAAGAGEGLYWKYESFLKKLDYQLFSVVGAAGELFAVRTDLFETPKSTTLIEDFVITMRIAEKGYRVAYEPKAKAQEWGSASTSEELKRKVRISAGGLQAIWMLRAVLNPFKYGLLTFQYISHRVLRWTLAPLALVATFVSSLLLAKLGDPLYQVFFVLQAVFYISAAAGYHFENVKTKFKAFYVPFYFTFMNISVYLGLFMLVSGKYSPVWDKAKRK